MQHELRLHRVESILYFQTASFAHHLVLGSADGRAVCVLFFRLRMILYAERHQNSASPDYFWEVILPN